MADAPALSPTKHTLARHAATQACTGMLVRTQDQQTVYARTMEFSHEQVGFNLIYVPRGQTYQGETPSGRPGLSWATRHAHLGFNPVGQRVVADGLNEHGLAVGNFFFPGFSQYAEEPANPGQTLAATQVASWILGQFATVQEVRQAIQRVVIVGVHVAQLGYVPPAHFLVADASGESLVIEFLNGQVQLHEASAGVITNSPDYAWHLTNLRNYLGLQALPQPATEHGALTLAPLGQGTGARGLPGDFTSPSRFVRAFFFNRVQPTPPNSLAAIHQAFHIMNQFDIPPGSVGMPEGNQVSFDATQWTVAADLQHRRYYFHTYADRAIKVLDLADFNPTGPRILEFTQVQAPGEIRNLRAAFGL